MDEKDNKSTIRLVIEIIICVLLVGVLILGGILIFRSSNNSAGNTNNTAVSTTQTDDKNKDNAADKDKASEDKTTPPTTVNITNNSDTSVVKPDSNSKTIINQVITPSSPQTTSFGTGDIYLADVYDFLSLRNASSTSAACIAKIAPCTELVILSNSTNNMVYVRVNSGVYSGYTGYVNGDYITRKGYTLQRGSTNSSYYYVSGTKDFLPIRSIAAIDDNYLIGKLYNGDTVLLLEKTNSKFWKVKDVDHNIVGYVVADYLRK